MLSVRAATSLLATCHDAAASRALLVHLGFDGEALPLPSALRDALGLEHSVAAGAILTGRGALRALTLALVDAAPAAQLVTACARRLAIRAPHALWVVVGTQHDPATLTIAIPRSTTVAMLPVDRMRVVDSDADTLAAMADAHRDAAVDLAVHARWMELLGRDALNRRFYRVLERRVHALADDASGGRTASDRADLALLCSSRLLFLAFLQAKGWLDGDREFLARSYERCMAAQGGFHRRVLRPLFFGTLNTPRSRRAAAARGFGDVPFLNGGLFAPARLESGGRAPELSDASLGAFLEQVLARYRFTAREDCSSAVDAAVDPEMLGRAFESLMASRERRSAGAFYTPSSFVSRVADGALLASIQRAMPARAAHAIDALRAGSVPHPAVHHAVRDAIASLKVLDPACGSGAFLVHALERLARWRLLAGDDRSPDAIRRELLARSIFGVDRDPTAVWLCELRLWLAVAVECDEPDPRRVPPLPNLDRNIRAGDALSGRILAEAQVNVRAPTGAEVTVMRARYAAATGARKRAVARALDRTERRIALVQVERELIGVADRRRDVVAALRGRDLFGQRAASTELDREATSLRLRAAQLRRDRQRLRDGAALPFRWDAHFADVIAAGGFTTIVGNPPWVRVHRIPPDERAALRERFTVLRHAAWAPGASAGGVGGGFAGQADLAALFVERSLALLRPGGVLSLLVPAKLWTTLAGGGVRRMLHADARVLALEDCTEAPDLFEAVTYPSIVVAERGAPAPASVGHMPGRAADVSVHRGETVARWLAPPRDLAWDESPGSPWLLLPPPVRSAFDRMRRPGRTLGDAGFGRPLMGVKCGHNDAFIVRTAGKDTSSLVRDATCEVVGRDGRVGAVEAHLLRPVIRGEQVRRWRVAASADQIVWTHGDTGVLRALPPHAGQWLAPHRARLAARSDARGRQPWWALHRVESAHERWSRVIWPDMARSPRAAWLEAGDRSVPLNTCYIVRCMTLADAHALAALLHTPLAAAWLRALAEPARGGFRRLFAWTMALLPLPADWQRAREILAPLALAARAADRAGEPSDLDLLDAALDAYRLRRRDMAPLLEWHPASGE